MTDEQLQSIFWGIIVAALLGAFLFFTNKWTDKHYEFKHACLEAGGDVFNGRCKLPEDTP